MLKHLSTSGLLAMQSIHARDEVDNSRWFNKSQNHPNLHLWINTSDSPSFRIQPYNETNHFAFDLLGPEAASF